MSNQTDLWPQEWDPLEMAYFAGFFDGEGSVGLYDSYGRQPHFRVSLCNNDVRPLIIVRSLFGGSIRQRIRQYKSKISRNWEWYIHGQRAERFVDVFLSARRLLPSGGNRFVSRHTRPLRDRFMAIETQLKQMKRADI